MEAVVLGIQKDEEKISWHSPARSKPMGYGCSQLSGGRPRPWKVQNITTYGAFVELEEGIDGMVHVSDMSWTRKVITQTKF